VTRLQAGWSGVQIPTWKRGFSLQNDQIDYGMHSAFYSGGTGAISQGTYLMIDLYLVLRLGMSGAVP